MKIVNFSFEPKKQKSTTRRDGDDHNQILNETNVCLMLLTYVRRYFNE